MTISLYHPADEKSKKAAAKKQPEKQAQSGMFLCKSPVSGSCGKAYTRVWPVLNRNFV